MKRIIYICVAVICSAAIFAVTVACDGIQDNSSRTQNHNTSNDVGVTMGEVTLDSLMFSLEGVIYTLPVHFSELEANGWIPYDPDGHFATEILEPGDSDVWELTNNEQSLLVFFTNLSEEMQLINKSYITSVFVRVREGLSEQFDAKLVLPGNIAIGSTLEDVLEAYGQVATWMNHSEEISTLEITYSSDYYSLRISVDLESDLVILMNMDYWGWMWAQADYESTQPDIEAMPRPTIVMPELDNVPLDSLMFGMKGVIYTLPTHFSELKNDGWSFCDERNNYCSSTYILKPGGLSSWQVIVNGDYVAAVVFSNSSEDVMYLNECYIILVSAHKNTIGVQPVFQDNIVIGSSYENVLAVYGTPNIRNRNRLIYETNYFNMQIYICEQTQLVISIAMKYFGYTQHIER